MKKNHDIKCSAATGRFVTKPLGKGKATKFSKVEGMTLSRKSAKTMSSLEGSGLKGDALRSAIRVSFMKKRVTTLAELHQFNNAKRERGE